MFSRPAQPQCADEGVGERRSRGDWPCLHLNWNHYLDVEGDAVTDDLVKRLRGDDICDYDAVDELCNEAADRIEQLEAVLRLGIDMREKQKAYFKRRFQDVLLDCKKAERDFDVSALAALGEKKDD
jgi:hypothetical protein